MTNTVRGVEDLDFENLMAKLYTSGLQHIVQIEEAIHLISMYDKYWENEREQFKSLVHKRSISTVYSCNQCVEHYVKEIKDGVYLDIFNKQAIKELSFLVERRCIYGL